MTKYKMMAQEAEERSQAAMYQIEILKEQLSLAQTGLVDEMCLRMESEEAREILRVFADRAKNKEELVLLIRALSKL